jgi:type II secretory pathway pseudopilin PulG
MSTNWSLFLKTKGFTKINKKGFLLIEVIASLALLSFSLIFIIEIKGWIIEKQNFYETKSLFLVTAHNASTQVFETLEKPFSPAFLDSPETIKKNFPELELKITIKPLDLMTGLSIVTVSAEPSNVNSSFNNPDLRSCSFSRIISLKMEPAL